MNRPKVELDKYLEGLKPEECRILFQDRLEGRRTVPLVRASSDESPEELLVYVLRHDTISPSIREAALAACRDLGKKLHGILIDGRFNDDNFADDFERWANVMDRVAPPELKALANGILQVAIETPDAPLNVLDCSVRAAMRFRLDEKDVQLWIQLLGREDLCAYGFTALLKIKPDHERISTTLFNLWKKVIRENWATNIDLLTVRAIRPEGSKSQVMRKLVFGLRSNESDLYSEILKRWTESRQGTLREIAFSISSQAFSHDALEILQSSVKGSHQWHRWIFRSQLPKCIDAFSQTIPFELPFGAGEDVSGEKVKFNFHHSHTFFHLEGYVVAKVNPAYQFTSKARQISAGIDWSNPRTSPRHSSQPLLDDYSDLLQKMGQLAAC